MSASREKKQRRDGNAQTMSARALEELQQEERRKRNAKIYTVIAAVVVVLVAILLIWDSGFFQRRATVATIDGEKVTAPQVMYYYYNNSIVSMAQTYSYYGLSFPYDTSVSAQDQVISEDDLDTLSSYGVSEEDVGKTYHEYFLENALETLREEYALRAAASAAGYTLSAEGQATVEEAMESLYSSVESYLSSYGVSLSATTYLQLIYGSTMTESTYRTCLENAQLAEEYYEIALAAADYSDEELEAYYLSDTTVFDTFDFYWRYFDTTMETTYDDDGEEVEVTEEEEEAYALEVEEEAYAILEELQQDASVVVDDEEYTEICSVLYGYSSAFYYDWIVDESRVSGDATIFEEDSGYYIIVFMDRYLDETPTVDVRHILISAMPEDDPDTEDVDESEEDPDDDNFDAAYATALEILAEFEAAGGTEEAFAELANTYSADSGSNTEGGLYTDVYDGQMISNFNDWIMDSSRQAGDVSDPIQNTESSTQGWHLIYFVGWKNPVWKTNAISYLFAEDVEAMAAATTLVTTSKLDSLFS